MNKAFTLIELLAVTKQSLKIKVTINCSNKFIKSSNAFFNL